MVAMKTSISWTDSSFNPTTGCTQISPGCSACYAKALHERMNGKGSFDIVTEHPNRLLQAIKFTPIAAPGQPVRARRVFVNSMSDFFHDKVSDAFRFKCFDIMDRMPETVWQILTKRPMTMRRVIEERYKASGMPRHIWLGVSVEDNRVRGRLDQLRRLKDSVGEFCAFVSVEPLIGHIDECDFSRIDWVIVGGESGPKARPMEAAWAFDALKRGRAAGAAVWGKQFGDWRNNPLYQATEGLGMSKLARIDEAIRRGELAAWIVNDPKTGQPVVRGEKGGATFAGKVWHEMPPVYEVINAAIRESRLA